MIITIVKQFRNNNINGHALFTLNIFEKEYINNRFLLNDYSLKIDDVI